MLLPAVAGVRGLRSLQTDLPDHRCPEVQVPRSVIAMINDPQVEACLLVWGCDSNNERLDGSLVDC